ncbi:MAG: amino acid permease, partial [Hydrogenophaga sp.]
FIIVLPFLLEIPIAIPHLKPANWLGTVDKIDWAPFVSTLLWNYQGWDSLGCIAGEVNDGGRTYPLGIGIALILIVITYLAPVAVGVSLDPNLSNWSEGYFETLARRLAPWLSGFMLAGSTVANLGEFNVVMSTTSRALWAMARLGFVPRKLSWTSRKYGTPVGAILM